MKAWRTEHFVLDFGTFSRQNCAECLRKCSTGLLDKISLINSEELWSRKSVPVCPVFWALTILSLTTIESWRQTSREISRFWNFMVWYLENTWVESYDFIMWSCDCGYPWTGPNLNHRDHSQINITLECRKFIWFKGQTTSWTLWLYGLIKPY